MSALICGRCGHEIKPGEEVDFIWPGGEEGELPRIIGGDEMIVSHVVCTRSAVPPRDTP